MFAKIVLALPFVSAAWAAVDGCTRTATIQAGDTCDSISHKYGVSTYQLALVNEATISDNCDNLEPNQEICLGVEGHDCTKVYTVVANDTCDWIQQTYGITNPTLVANNPQIDAKCENIYVGEVLCVDTDDYVYPETLAWSYLPWCDEQ